jgi:hypothetical protein
LTLEQFADYWSGSMRPGVLGAWTLVSMLAATPCGAHSFPATAPLLKVNLVQGYPACSAPNTMTSTGRPACLSTDELDPGCLFGSKGFGVLTARIEKSNIDVSLRLRGLDPLCEGRHLGAAFTVRTTTDDCPNEHCTVVDYEVTGGSCTVKKGKCALKTAIPTGYPAGAGSEMTLVTCGVKDGDKTAFTCGIMVK